MKGSMTRRRSTFGSDDRAANFLSARVPFITREKLIATIASQQRSIPLSEASFAQWYAPTAEELANGSSYCSMIAWKWLRAASLSEAALVMTSAELFGCGPREPISS